LVRKKRKRFLGVTGMRMGNRIGAYLEEVSEPEKNKEKDSTTQRRGRRYSGGGG